LRPINGDGMWEKGPGKMISAPYFKLKKKTTCKFKRRPKAGEKRKAAYGKVSKEHVKLHCSNCGGEEHNKITCN